MMNSSLHLYNRLARYRRRVAATALFIALLFIVSLFIVRSSQDTAWARVKQRGVITFATDPTFAPFESLDGEGNFTGFDIDLARALAARLGLKAEFEAVSYDGLIGTLVVGRDDAVISAFVIQPERGKEASFTPPYFDAGLVLVTRAGTAVTGHPQQWAAGKTLAAEYGSTGDALARRLDRVELGTAAIESLASYQARIVGRLTEKGLPTDEIVGEISNEIKKWNINSESKTLKI